MVQIDNQKIGAFIAAKRKEGNMTQKELGDKLFVSDKTVSKWERGLSIPNVVLLIPLAEVLHISVTELLRGEQINEDQVLNADEVERLVTDSLDLTLQHTIKQRRQGWRLAYLISLLIGAAEITLLLRIG
ncbi:MAG TPA: XRE family transcriptional regulator, partial [Dielma fastidiosa]|nr:XRE family transcriptional regulator [Dielma fastidiosa]